MTEELDNRLLDSLVMTAFDVMGVLTQVAADNDISLTQLRVLAILRDRRPRMSELAGYLGLDRSTVSGLVERGEARGLLARVADEMDGRSSRVNLTELGRSVALAGERDIRLGVAPLVGGLSLGDRERLIDLLERRVPGASTPR